MVTMRPFQLDVESTVRGVGETTATTFAAAGGPRLPEESWALIS
jgi:hypothetical protein